MVKTQTFILNKTIRVFPSCRFRSDCGNRIFWALHIVRPSSEVNFHIKKWQWKIIQNFSLWSKDLSPLFLEAWIFAVNFTLHLAFLKDVIRRITFLIVFRHLKANNYRTLFNFKSLRPIYIIKWEKVKSYFVLVTRNKMLKKVIAFWMTISQESDRHYSSD